MKVRTKTLIVTYLKVLNKSSLLSVVEEVGDVEEEEPADDETEAEEKDLWPDRLLEKLKCELPAELALLEREL